MKYKCFYGAAALFWVSCATTPSSFPERVIIPYDIAGTCHAGSPRLSPEDARGENALMDELGMTWIRNDFYWTRIEPRRGEWDFSYYDALVEKNKKAGRKILAILAFDNRWLYKNNKTRDYIAPEHLPLYLNYVEQTVRRYKGKVDAWEIWNEPNVSIRFWNGPAKDFFALSKAAAAKIKEVDPAAYVIAGAFFRSPTSFIARMEKAGALENVDGLSVHPYASNPHAVLAVYEKFEKQVRGLGFTGDIWVTEAGFPVAGYYPWRTPEKKLGDTIIKTLTLLAAKGARAIVWYQLTESYVKAHTPKTIDSEDFFGIAYRDYEKREGAALFGVLIKAIAGAEYLRDWPGKGELPPGTIAFCFKKPSGELLLVRWAKNMPAVLEKR